MSVIPTDEQRRVIESDDPHLVVAAAAGSGKTRVLVERFLRLVSQGYRPDQILTITYTRKAAAEMKRRIVDELKKAGNAEAAQIAETGPIQTVHGFCERTLRENAIAAKLDPDFEIIEQGDQSALVSRSITESLALPFAEDEEDSFATELVEALAGRRGGAKAGQEQDSPHQVLIDSVSRVISKFRGTSMTVSDLERMAESPEALLATWREQVLDSLPESVREALVPEGTLDEQLAGAYKAAKVAKPRWVRPQEEPDTVAARHTVALLHLAAAAWRKIEADMTRRAKLDFILLERLAVDLVVQNPSVRARLAKQYPIVFVDEAQDLNPMQYQLLDALTCGHRMLVGDAQQSIYGFRLADVDLFRNHPVRAEIVPLPLSKNFRSEPGILAFVDAMFKQVWGERYRPMGEDGNVIYLDSAPKPAFDGVELWPLEQRDTSAVARMVADLVAEQKQARDVCILVRRSSYGADLLRRLERIGVKAQLVGGTERYFTRMEVRDVANALRALVNPHDDFSLLATLRSPFAGVSLDAITMLAAGEDKKQSVYSQLSDGGGVTAIPEDDLRIIAEFRAWFDPMSRYADRLAAWEAIGELYATSPFLEALARRSNHAQLLANVRKLLALATAQPEMGPAEFAERVRETQRLGHREGEAPVDDEGVDAVTIMTIHKAKGLEFPVVVVPETHDQIARPPWGWVMADARMPMVATRFPGGGNIYAEFLSFAEGARGSEEEWRVLYVALTRAKSRLCVVIDPRKRTDSYAGLMAKHLGFSAESHPLGVRVREL